MKTKGFIRGVPYRLASFYGRNGKNPSDDICIFIRQASWGLIKLIGWSFVGAMISSVLFMALCSPVIASIVFFQTGVFIWNPDTMLPGIAIWGIIFVIIFVIWSIATEAGERFSQRTTEFFKSMKKPKKIKEPGIIKLWYRSLKEHTCFKINFED